MMIQMSEDAWSELMLEKMKKEFEKVNGAKMDKAAALAVEASMNHWKGKMEMMGKHKEFGQKLMSVMGN